MARSSSTRRSSQFEGDGLAHLFEPLADFATLDRLHGRRRGDSRLGPRVLLRRPGSTSASNRSRSEFSANAQVGVEIHELAHALVRCDRREEDPKLTYAEEEVVVECVAHTVCATVGLDTSDWSVPYMATWGEGDEIARYAELIDRLATRLEDAALALGAPVADEELVAA